jgi:methylmalonyl-CoA mutase N-terminal domain/subunit
MRTNPAQRIPGRSEMIEEAHLARVIDPAGGSWSVERMTAEPARAGRAFLQEIEAAGGAVAALDSGFIARPGDASQGHACWWQARTRRRYRSR